MRTAKSWRLAAASACAIPWAASGALAAERPTLATPGQLEREALALEVLAQPRMREAVARVESLYRSDSQAKTPSGAATLSRAAESIALAAIYYAVLEDTERPVLLWSANAAHRWFGLELPRAGYGIENPDNVYRQAMLDGSRRYEIRGRFPSDRPVELHFTVMDAIPGTQALAAEGGGFVSTLRDDAMRVAEDGSFTITLDSDPAGSRANHLQLPREGRVPLFVRDLFSDWSRQTPVELGIARVGGPALAAPPARDVLAARAAELLATLARHWLDYDNRFVYSRPVNSVATPRRRPGGRGLSASGHFALAPDEALIVTLDALGAASLGFQLTDPWGVAYDYVDHTSSLNQTQAQPNTDGTFSFAIAANDPGVHNWLDPSGQSAGIFAIRWQALPEGADPARAVRSARVVKQSELRAALPESARFVTSAEREDQRRARAQSYARRVTP